MDKNKIFLINWGELEGRFDAELYKFANRNIFINLLKNKNIQKLKTIIKESSYGVLPPGDSYSKDLPITFIRATELKENLKIDFESALKVEKKYLTKRATLKKNDILIAVKGATIASKKSIAFVNDKIENCIINGSIFRFQVKDSVLALYVAYILDLDSMKKQVKAKIVSNNAVDYLNKENIENLLIPIPSLNIQEKIIKIMNYAYKVTKQKEKEAQDLLDSIDNYLFNKLGIILPNEPENNIKNRTFKVGFDDIFADRLDADSYTSYYQNIFETFEKSTCKFTTLKTITKKIKTGTTPDQKLDAFTTEKEIAFLRNSDIQDGEIIEDKFKYIKNDLEKYLTFSYKNEIIICIAGTIGISALNRFDRLAINQNVSSLTIDETQININFLIYWLNTKVAISLLKRLASIATIAYVNNPTLLRLQIPLPHITIQNEIADEIKQRRQKAKQLQNEAKLELENAKKEVEKIILGEAYES